MITPSTLAFIGGFGMMELLMMPFMLAGLGFWILMIVDSATKEEDAGSKIAWILVILLVGIIGAPLYFFIRKLPRKAKLT